MCYNNSMEYCDFKQKFNITLNEQQEIAVKKVDGALLLLAVPGSGKTTVLVNRLGYMVFAKGIPANKILTVTYTRIATKEMQERFAKKFGASESDLPDFRTINSLSEQIVLKFERDSERTAPKLVTGERQNEIVSSCCKKFWSGYPTETDIKNVKTLITFAKNMMLEQEQIEELNERDLPFSDIYAEYCSELKNNGLMDYDDQMVFAYQILKGCPQVLEYYRNKYEYICVDEAQDTSKIQHAIISLIAKPRCNVFMVGDEDQSIYGFRAAYPDALINFSNEYPNAEILYLETNYRSTPNIVEVAGRFIKNNKFRYPKKMSAEQNKKGEIKIIQTSSRSGQYSRLLTVASQTQTETAVLYRENESALPLVDILDRNGVPFNIRRDDYLFFTNRVVTDIVNIINFAYYPKNIDLFKQVYYKISTHLKKEQVDKICNICARNVGFRVMDTAIYQSEPNRVNKNCLAVSVRLKNILKSSASGALNIIRQELGYEKFLERAGISSKSLDILQEIAKREPTAKRLVERLEELNDKLKNKPPVKDCKFLLSTIHSSKGLEYDTVYMLDAFDGVFPVNIVAYKENDSDYKNYEEERRMFYVGITRAKNSLNFFKWNTPTTFLDQTVKTLSTGTVNGGLNFNLGQIVAHKEYGMGIVLYKDLEFVEIRFQSIGVKRFSKRVLSLSDKITILR